MGWWTETFFMLVTIAEAVGFVVAGLVIGMVVWCHISNARFEARRDLERKQRGELP